MIAAYLTAGWPNLAALIIPALLYLWGHRRAKADAEAGQMLSRGLPVPAKGLVGALFDSLWDYIPIGGAVLSTPLVWTSLQGPGARLSSQIGMLLLALLVTATVADRVTCRHGYVPTLVGLVRRAVRDFTWPPTPIGWLALVAIFGTLVPAGWLVAVPAAAVWLIVSIRQELAEMLTTNARAAQAEAQLVAVFGRLEPGSVRAEANGEVLITPLSPVAITHLPDLDARLALMAPDLMVGEAGPYGVWLVPVDAAARAARQTRIASGGLVLGRADGPTAGPTAVPDDDWD